MDKQDDGQDNAPDERIPMPDEVTSPPSNRGESGGERAYNAIKELAIKFEFMPGQSINEKEISEKLGVSRTPIREALNRLVVEGLLNFVPKRGFFARNLDVQEVLDLYEMRVALEVAALRLACDRASDDEIAALRDYWEDVGANYNKMTVDQIARRDEEFHTKLVALAKNEQISMAVGRVADRIRFCRMIDLENRTRRGPLYDEHTDILDALERRDHEAGTTALSDHVSMSRDQAVEVIKEGLARIFMKDGSTS